ncbi:MAG: patatin-like phospholipase family protein [Chloroflexota bacterium]
MTTVRTLILSGGGGRGAFHAGVYKYLSQAAKPGVDPAHQGAWEANIVVGTSIGAVNGAAIVQGITADEMENIWRGLREHDIQGLPPGMRGATRWISNLLLRQFIGVKLPKVPSEQATSPTPQESWISIGPRWLTDRLVGRWSNLLDTGPLKRTLETKLHIDLQKIADSQRTLLINATNVRTGERVTFSNRVITQRNSGEPRPDVIPGIDLQRILASCSIPLVYPWTYDEQTAEVYWDGAVVANTPLSGALDAAQEWPIETPMEVVVVMMTPWVDRNQDGVIDERDLPLPSSFSEALTVTLDWALLATFRERLRITEAYNRLAQMEREHAQRLKSTQQDGAGSSPTETFQPRYRQVNVVVVAPEKFFPAARILDYDERTEQLILLGYQAAERAFRGHFPDLGAASKEV